MASRSSAADLGEPRGTFGMMKYAHGDDLMAPRARPRSPNGPIEARNACLDARFAGSAVQIGPAVDIRLP